MKTIANRTGRPIRIKLGGGRFLHLGPRKTGQISDKAADEPGLKKLIKAGEIEIVGQGTSTRAGSEGGGVVHEATHGHPQTTVVLPKGNR